MRRALALRLCLLAVCCAAAARPAAAQWSYRMDLGGAAADGPARDAPLLFDGRLAWSSERLALSLAGGNAPTSLMPGGAHGRVTAALRALSWDGGSWRGALEVAATAARRSDFIDARREELAITPRLAHGPWTIAAEGSVSEMREWERRDARAMALSLRRDFDFGALTIGARHVTFADSQTVTRDTVYVVAGFEYKSSYQVFGRGRRQYTDATVGLDLYLGRTSLGLTLGGRGEDLAGTARAWGSIDVLVPLRPGLALHVGGGRTGGVPEQRFESSRFATLALQLTGGSRRLYEAIAPTSGGEPRLQVISAANGMHLIRITGVPARRVEVQGDFTEWAAVPLDSAPAGAWQKAFALRPGVHRILMRVDGGEWGAPPELPVENDEFGGRIGVLYVPERG